jgi:hypothetical protein
MGELALNVVLSGDLPKPEYPVALSRSAGRQWLADARASLGYARGVLAQRGDVAAALANASRGIIEAAQGRMAQQQIWYLNEKGIAEAAGLGPAAEGLLAATSTSDLGEAIERAAELIDA